MTLKSINVVLKMRILALLLYVYRKRMMRLKYDLSLAKCNGGGVHRLAEDEKFRYAI